jgi:hypothetical protein
MIEGNKKNAKVAEATKTLRDLRVPLAYVMKPRCRSRGGRASFAATLHAGTTAAAASAGAARSSVSRQNGYLTAAKAGRARRPAK